MKTSGSESDSIGSDELKQALTNILGCPVVRHRDSDSDSDSIASEDDILEASEAPNDLKVGADFQLEDSGYEADDEELNISTPEGQKARVIEYKRRLTAQNPSWTEQEVLLEAFGLLGLECEVAQLVDQFNRLKAEIAAQQASPADAAKAVPAIDQQAPENASSVVPTAGLFGRALRSQNQPETGKAPKLSSQATVLSLDPLMCDMTRQFLSLSLGDVSDSDADAPPAASAPGC